ncbi:sodium-dependent transporter [Tepidibacillus fermentans]|uniref:Transporter n=1 Tax=Tepidibacillus fermentans TaxID=1281767 RepID=A0A4V2USW7_9BACI|nr:sodium-dependent transporter [Tepidibacillus fermentans]TCS83091.1 NSS family neurotransmitter:Na+ symporter [Tepidibacillus fermentans]
MGKREEWGSRAGFLLAAIGSAVGLGNIWRFPYVAYENGGGAFLIPYFFALLTAGIPILILEFGVGHKFKGSAPLSFRRISRNAEWLGWWQVFISFIIMMYYVVIIAWSANYIWFSVGLKWGKDTNAFLFSEYLHISKGVWNFGGIQWPIFFTLLGVWAVIFFILFRGVKAGIEKASKFLMPLLAVIMILFTIRGVTLPGAVKGLNVLLTPDFSKIFDANTWVAAYGQIFYSLSVAFAIMITYSSYLPEKAEINNSAFITGFANSGFEFLAALGVFGVIGFMSQSTGIPIDKVAGQGVGLAFVVFPQIINQLPAMNSLIGVLFFTALFIAGLTSAISILEVVIAAIMDKFMLSRKQAVIYSSLVGFLGSVIYTSGGGLYYLDIVDHFINAFGIVLSGITEVILLGWFFNLTTIREHNNLLSDYRIGSWWEIMIRFVTPIILGIMTVINFYNEFTKLFGGGDYPLNSLIVFGWGVALAAITFAVIVKTIPGYQKEGI